jgi:flagellar basal-body rod protein FlgC
MGLFPGLEISASALTAERLRMDVAAENLANAQTTRTAEGGPYRRKEVVLEQAGDSGFGAQLRAAIGVGGGRLGTLAGAAQPGGVRVSGVVQETADPRRVYDPTHPDADDEGYVAMPNVDSVTEMVDLITASRGYEANVTAMSAAKQMYSKTIDMLRS